MPYPQTILSQVPPDVEWYFVIDLANSFFQFTSIPLSISLLLILMGKPTPGPDFGEDIVSHPQCSMLLCLTALHLCM